MVGHSELLEVDPTVKHWKANKLDLAPLIRRVGEPYGGALCKTKPQDHGLAKALDNQILADAKEAVEKGTALKLRYAIDNTKRSVATMLGAEISRKHGSAGLPEGTIQLEFTGSAGQSFGAFTPKGISLRIEGDANDYVGKGLCGGRIIVLPHPKAPFKPEDNSIVGNTVLYGATSGEAYIRGRAGERFCVRNSGVHAVVEGLGDHGCEYMTGGRVVVLGPTGRNFGAGMSGGIAYVLDLDGGFSARCNMELVELEDLDPGDEELVKELLRKHQLFTGSTVAENVLERWREMRRRIVKVIPSEYKKALQAQAEEAAETVAG
jgi:glutamate synthase domain-containing protein 3